MDNAYLIRPVQISNTAWKLTFADIVHIWVLTTRRRG